MKLKKSLVYLQIVLQIVPPSSLLLMSTSSVAAVQEVSAAQSTSPDDPSASDSTEQTVAKTAVQAGSVLSSGNSSSVASALSSAATGTASAEIQSWLNQFGTARASISTDEHFSLDNSDVDLLLPLFDDHKNNLLFTQLGGRRNDDRNIVNSGLGYRYTTESWMWGANIFYDRQISGNQHQRLGLGTELGWDNLKLSANGYYRLSNWMASTRYEDYDERVANGFDIRATGYIPAYPQLGANVIYEQYYGDDVGLFGDDEDDRQKNPHAITLGVNYTPFPLMTIGVNQKFGKNGKDESQVNLAFSWTPGVPFSAQMDPSLVASRRSVMGGRQDLVDRNNNIVLEYRKQELISLALPPLLEGNEKTKLSASAKIKSKYGVDHIEWQGDSFFKNGGKIDSTSGSEQFFVTLPTWQSSGVNSYTLTGTAWDKNGNVSNASQMKVNVNGIDVTTLQSTTTASPATLPADGSSVSTVTLTLKNSAGEYASGLTERLSTTLIVSEGTSATPGEAVKKSSLSSFTENSPGSYTATFTSGTTPETITVQPLIDSTTKLATTKIITEAVSILPKLTQVDTSAPSASADGSSLITLTAHVVDQFGNAVKDAVINWSADNDGAQLSAAQSATDAQGLAQITVTSSKLLTTIVTATLQGGNSVVTPSLSFTADISTAQVVAIKSEKPQVVANNMDSNTVKALVNDKNGHPLEGITVNWSINKTDNTQAGSKTSVTDSQGIAELTLKSTKTGTIDVTASVNDQTEAKKTDPITFIADSSTQKVNKVTLDHTQAIANGIDSITYQATVTDNNNNPLEGIDVTWSANNSNVQLSATHTVSDSNGTATIVVTSLKAGDVIVTAQTSDVTPYHADSAAFIADHSSAKVVEVKSDRPSALANGSDKLTLSAKVTDANDNLITGEDVTWTVTPASGVLSATTSQTDSSGIATATLSSLDTVSYEVIATANGIAASASNLNFTADAATAQVMSVTPDKSVDVVADKDRVTLTALVQDANHHPLANATVNWTSSDESNSTFTSATSTTDASGTAITTFSTLKAGSINVTATSGSSSQTQTLLVIGNIETADFASLVADKNESPADGTTQVTWKATIVDANQNPVKNAQLTWHSDNTIAVPTPTSSATDANGEAITRVTATKTGDVVMTAELAQPAKQRSANAVKFVSNMNTAEITELTHDISSASIGSSRVTYKATVKDANGNVLENATVNWSTTLNDLSATTSVTDSNGNATIKLSGKNKGYATVTAEINGSMDTDSGVKFVDDYQGEWNIVASNSSTRRYTSSTIFSFTDLGFVAAGNTIGPDKLVWRSDAKTTLTVPMTDDKGQSWNVVLVGNRISDCTTHSFNTAITCSTWATTGYRASLTYNASDNPSLPAGTYHGVVQFAGKDWNTDWALNYAVTTSLVIE